MGWSARRKDRRQETELPLLDTLHSTPARHYLSDRPIPEEILWALLDAAIRGPSAKNSQNWGWVVVTDRSVKAAVAQLYLEEFEKAHPPGAGADSAPDGMSPATFRGGRHLAEHCTKHRS